jgi:hypothetical protein
MSRFMRQHIAAVLFVFAGLILFSVVPAAAQTFPSFHNPFPSHTPRSGFLQSFLESEMPGIADPKASVVYPPIFRGEITFRPVVITNWGNVERMSSGRRLDFQDDLDMREVPVLVESLIRAQISRISLRLQFETYLSDFQGPNARMDWPNFRYGLDFDLVDTPTLRIGVNLDAYREGIRFGFTGTPLGSWLLVTGRPITAGVHAAYNPIRWGTLSFSCATRGRMSLQNSQRVDDAEVSLGFRGPELVLGSMALRGGWRYSRIEFSDQGFEVYSVWSSFFGELVYYF